MARINLTTEEALVLLEQNPRRIEEIVAGLTEKQLHTPPGPEKWSANEVLAHLRSCSDVWGKYMRQILAEDRPTIRVVNPRTWIKSTDYVERGFATSFREFCRQRTALLRVLKALEPKSWARKATITGAGAPLEKTVLSYAIRLAGHERTHLKQFRRIAETMRQRR